MTQKYSEIKAEGLKEPMVEIEKFIGMMNSYYFEQLRIQAKVSKVIMSDLDRRIQA